MNSVSKKSRDFPKIAVHEFQLGCLVLAAVLSLLPLMIKYRKNLYG
jgi:hypothetical protein